MNQKFLLAAGALIIVLLAAGGLLLANRAEVKTDASTESQTEQIEDGGESEEQSEDEELTEDADDEDEDTEDEDKEEASVTLSSAGFSPKTITVKAGDTVVWKNDLGKSATVDSAPHPVHTSYPPLNLGGFSDGETLELTFTEAGTYSYHNHLNASQTGSVIVE